MIPETLENYIKEEWFKDHEAHYTPWPLQQMEIVVWKNPKRSTYLINYIRAGNYLYVSGDVGDAIYCTGFDSLQRWSESDVGYFAGKCVASESGRLYREWDRNTIQKSVKEALKNYSDKTWSDLEAFGGTSHMTCEEEWHMWLSMYANEFFGPDPCYWPTDGKIVSERCRGHLIGLKMVVKQLTEKGEIK